MAGVWTYPVEGRYYGMWGIFVGLGLGALQVFLLRKTVHMVTGNGTNAALGVLISVGKLALILVVLFLLAWFTKSAVPVLWCGGGIAISMIALAVIMNVIDAKKKDQQSGEGAEQ